MKFEYDARKSYTNKAKHGTSLNQAASLWYALGVEVETRSTDEKRWMRIGQIKGKCYSCIYTLRGVTARLISARRSRKSEEAIYYEQIKQEK